MSGNCDGTCVFHDQYEAKLNTVYDWHLGATEREKLMKTSIDTMTLWFRRFVFAIIVAVSVQIIIPIVKAGVM